jgi:membrane fusion protein (multidrug efflux system)
MPQTTETTAVPIQTNAPQPAAQPAQQKLPAENRSASEPPERPQGFFATHPKAPFYLAVIALVLLVGGYFAYNYFSSYESTDDAEVDGHLQPLSARISGYITKVNVDDNQTVQAGTVLAEIDPRDYQAALDKAEADLADAIATARASNLNVPITAVNTTSQISVSKADVENAQAGITSAEQQYEVTKAQLDQARANDVKAQNDLIRYKQLVDKQEISQQQYDSAVAAAKASTATVVGAQSSAASALQQITQAKTKLAQAEANLRYAETAPRQVETTEARASSADATVKEKQAAVETATLNLSYTKIVAPVSGTVTKNAEVGMNVSPGQQLFSIVPLNEVWVTANYKETQLKNMKVGQRAVIKVDANGREYKAHVDSIANSSGARTSLLPPENATGNYVKVVQRIPVKIVLEPGQNDDLYLRLGMSVEPKVYVK